MRWDWIPLSASALVIGVMALTFGSVLNPLPDEADAVETVARVAESGRWLGMAVMYFLASVTLTLGLPSMLSLFTMRGRRVGVLAVAVFAVGVLGMSGYAMLLVFFRALVRAHAIRTASVENVTNDLGQGVFLYGWVACFYGGLLLLAIALFLARRTPVWVPVLLLGFVAMLTTSSTFGRVAQVVQLVALAFAFTGIAVAAVNPAERPRGGAAARSGSAPTG